MININMEKITHQLHSRYVRSHLIIIITSQTTPCVYLCVCVDSTRSFIWYDIVMNPKWMGFDDKYQNVWWNWQERENLRKKNHGMHQWKLSFSGLIPSVGQSRQTYLIYTIFMKRHVRRQVNYSHLQCGNCETNELFAIQPNCRHFYSTLHTVYCSSKTYYCHIHVTLVFDCLVECVLCSMSL